MQKIRGAIKNSRSAPYFQLVEPYPVPATGANPDIRDSLQVQPVDGGDRLGGTARDISGETFDADVFCILIDGPSGCAMAKLPIVGSRYAVMDLVGGNVFTWP
jgi:hypothetical protein